MATFKIDLNINQAIKSDLVDRHLLCQQVQHREAYRDDQLIVRNPVYSWWAACDVLEQEARIRMYFLQWATSESI
jgi:hypothetical protein